jgi:hypothetical protein
MLSITLAILALYSLEVAKMYTLEVAKMATQPRAAIVWWVISVCLAICAVGFAAWREIIREG